MVLMGVRCRCAGGEYLRQFNKDIVWVRSGWEVREWTRIEKEIDIGDGLVRSAVEVS